MHLTKFGRYYLGLVLLMIVAAANTKTNLLNLFTAFLLALVVLSWTMLKANLGNLTVRIESPGEVFANEPFPVRYLISNQTIYPKFGLSLCDAQLKFSASDPHHRDFFTIADVPPRSTAAVGHELVWPRRGVCIWNEIKIASSFPFDLMAATIHLKVAHELVVLPKPRSYSHLPLPTKASMFREGSFVSSVTRTASQDFSGLREYQPGDSPKNIHWKASARAEKLIVKEYEENLPAGVSIVLDLFQEHYPDLQEDYLFEQAISLAASLVWDVAHQGYLILFAQAQRVVRYGRGTEHAMEILRGLAQADRRRDIGERSAVVQAIAAIPNSTTAIFICFCLRPEIEEYFVALAASGCQVIAIVLDERESAKAIAGVELYRLAGEQHDSLVLEKIS